MARLNPADREFFVMLADFVFGNPFNRQRNELIARLAPGVPVGDLTTHRDALARVRVTREVFSAASASASIVS